MTESTTLSRDRDADPGGGFDEFVRTRYQALLRSAYLLTGDRHLAEDLVQDALARTYGAWRRLDSGGNAEAYTRKILYNLQVSWWRRRRVAEVLPGELSDTAVRGDHADGSALRITLHRALLRLPARMLAVVVLRYFEDRSEVETAQILDCAVGTVKSTASKALARLRDTAPELAELITSEGDAR
ncbi:DNA-directed RNA polymerase sigma-70 factor [Longispora fulva]|uniref:RNA polymerase sigma-70 factor (Sigma-E family) n=1 Tax=Longispora fulva TaxID=619741 RepID=A0A8J7G758_9ACTN|nr:SigE family RNA polymerase sigma factor [Longispora fulva]MBG6134928.1 RNA polymerase sigma-70 factor (sigma-E family) [Longispora fulva]GIG56840.1 DNA-directed RNA polymerase sigma-70 factor [Longispora fulva]